MGQVVALEVHKVGQPRLAAVVEVVVGQVVPHVAQQAPRRQAHRLRVRQQQPEGGVYGAEEDAGEDRGEDEAHGVHGQQVVHPVHQKVQRDGQVAPLHPLVEVEDEAVQKVLEEGPHKQAREEDEGDVCAGHADGEAVQHQPRNHRQPQRRDHVPRGAGEVLEEVRLEEAGRLVQHLRPVDESVVVGAEVSDLKDDRLSEIDASFESRCIRLHGLPICCDL
mmetsp:Transcript_52864/g.110290  ORF Transcript_52864/g.110290 Transcript_52864/m.110290 type:complete len:221 (+) Transcript_52864:149-811(+)